MTDAHLISCTDAHLGLTTTEELLLELEARGRLEHRAELINDGERLSNVTASLLEDLPVDVLTYKTVCED
jgi:hypothetical protein